MSHSARITPPPVARVSQQRSGHHQPLMQPTTVAKTALTGARRRRSRKRTWQEFARQQRDRARALQDAPPWLVSLILHLLLLLTLALITFHAPTGKGLLLTFSQSSGQPTPALAMFSIEPVNLEWTSTQESPQTASAFDDFSINVPIKLASLAKSDSKETHLSSLDSLVSPSLASSSTGMPSMFAGRTGTLKQALLKSGGGTDETEQAVALGLAWLKRQQNKDGSWSMVGPFSLGSRAENRTAATAMAMLAFMGAGNTHKSGEYKSELSKAVKWLIEQQDRHGFMAPFARGNEKMYAQAQATIALCELYAMTKDYRLHPFAQKACDFACESQSPQGGWRYTPRFDSDTSVTGWFVMGLKSGHAAGLQIGSNVFPKVEKYLDSVGSDYNSGYAYQVGQRPSPSMTAEGILCRQYLGWHHNMPAWLRGSGHW